jgi:hypothetical protein
MREKARGRCRASLPTPRSRSARATSCRASGSSFTPTGPNASSRSAATGGRHLADDVTLLALELHPPPVPEE